jgi:ribosomal protein L29
MPRGRAPGFRMPDEHRVKIANSNIINALIEHAEGKREMSPTQVHAGLGLLKKVLPDLAAMDVSGQLDQTLTVQIVRYSEESFARDQIAQQLEAKALPGPSMAGTSERH